MFNKGKHLGWDSTFYFIINRLHIWVCSLRNLHVTNVILKFRDLYWTFGLVSVLFLIGRKSILQQVAQFPETILKTLPQFLLFYM